MRILMTGATASQSPNVKSRGTPTFSRFVEKALQEAGHEVTWINPSVSLSENYLDEFDSVVVGISPPTSTAAHRIYGALSVIHFARNIGKLTLMVDAPDPRRLWSGIRAIRNKPEDLTKDFYSKRKEYSKTLDESVLTRLHSSIDFLYTEEWPTTIFPSLPWSDYPSISSEIPRTNKDNLVGLNFDSLILSDTSRSITTKYETNRDYWVSDSINTKWSKSIEKTVVCEVEPIRKTRWEDNEKVVSRINSSLGCLISVYDKGSPWWSPYLSQSLALSIPVVTDWKLSSMLGEEWSLLANSVEELSEKQRRDLSHGQKKSYSSAIPSWKESVQKTSSALVRK